MPRTSANPYHPLRLLRKALEKTQPQFGRLVGCSGETIKSIEIGRADISSDLFIGILAATGVPLDVAQVRNGRLIVAGEEYTKEHFNQCSDWPHEGIVGRAHDELGLLMAAAVEQRRHLQVAIVMTEIIREVVDRFGLTPTIKRLAPNFDTVERAAITSGGGRLKTPVTSRLRALAVAESDSKMRAVLHQRATNSARLAGRPTLSAKLVCLNKRLRSLATPQKREKKRPSVKRIIPRA